MMTFILVEVLQVKDIKLVPSNQAPTLVADYYSEAVVDVYLKRTGSYLGGDYDYIITSSVYDASTGLGGYSGSIYSGSILTFSDGPIEIYNDVPVSTNTQSSYNQVGDMYYVEYSMSRFKSGYYDNSQQIAQNIAFETDSDLSRIEITQSAEGSGASTYNATGSLKLRKYKLGDPVSGLGQEVLSIPFQPIGFTNPITVDIESPLTEFFEHDDVYKFSIALDKVNVGSGMLVQELTASIFPGQSIWAPLVSTPAVNNYKTASATDFIVPTYYGDDVLPFSLALDCQPMLNNYSLGRENTWLMDVSYNNQSGSIIPVNQEQILSGSAVRATVPDSNYTQLSSIIPKYKGAKSTSQQLNLWNIGDTGTFGKNPTIELRDAYFGYFNDISDPYPNLNAVTQVNINYLIDEQGNALPPFTK